MRHPLAKDSAQVTLRWRFHRSAQNLQPKRLQVFINLRREDRVTIMDEKAMSMITGNSFAKLLHSPISSGMLGLAPVIEDQWDTARESHGIVDAH
jgi:hypothetical protein